MREVYLILHFIGLAMSVGIGFAMIGLGIATKDLDKEERAKYMLRAFFLSKIGSIGFLLLIISGTLLLVPIWPSFKTVGSMHQKLTLVVIMAGLIGYMNMSIKKAKADGGGPIMARIPKIGMAMFVTGMLIIIMAVLTFH